MRAARDLLPAAGKLKQGPGMIGSDAADSAVLEQIDSRDCFASVYLARALPPKADAGESVMDARAQCHPVCSESVW